MPEKFESFLEKALRHIKDGDLSPSTIKRGLKFFGEYARSGDVIQTKIQHGEVIHDYENVEGVTVRRYELIGKNGEIYSDNDITLTEFPKGTRLQLFVTEKDEPRRDTNTYFLDKEGSLAEITGPTVSRRLPNNGFYSAEDSTAFVKFEDTNPSGQRRGAIAQSKNGEVELIDDTKKWEIVRSDFEGYDFLSGTSVYFTDEDDYMHDDGLTEADRSKISYLIQYEDAEGKKRIAHLLINLLVPRLIARELITQFGKDVNARSFFAVELELLGANCNLRSGDKAIPLAQGGSDIRRDHYVLFREETKSFDFGKMIKKMRDSL